MGFIFIYPFCLFVHLPWLLTPLHTPFTNFDFMLIPILVFLLAMLPEVYMHAWTNSVLFTYDARCSRGSMGSAPMLAVWSLTRSLPPLNRKETIRPKRLLGGRVRSDCFLFHYFRWYRYSLSFFTLCYFLRIILFLFMCLPDYLRCAYP